MHSPRFSDDPVCPHCLHIQEVDEIPEEGTFTCQSCDKNFSLRVSRSVSYTSTCAVEDMTDEDYVEAHDFRYGSTSISPIGYPDAVVCQKCDGVQFIRYWSKERVEALEAKIGPVPKDARDLFKWTVKQGA